MSTLESWLLLVGIVLFVVEVFCFWHIRTYGTSNFNFVYELWYKGMYIPVRVIISAWITLLFISAHTITLWWKVLVLFLFAFIFVWFLAKLVYIVVFYKAMIRQINDEKRELAEMRKIDLEIATGIRKPSNPLVHEPHLAHGWRPVKRE